MMIDADLLLSLLDVDITVISEHWAIDLFKGMFYFSVVVFVIFFMLLTNRNESL